MVKFLTCSFLSLLIATGSAYAQGQVVFANKVGTDVDAPVFLDFTSGSGLGPSYTAQLFLVGGGSLTALLPSSTFRAAGSGAQAIADRYWLPQTVDVPVSPGSVATFVVRAFQTSYGGYDQALAEGGNFGQSAPFSVTVGGGILPPSNLVTLQSFAIPILPEPSVLTVGAIGGLLLLYLRKRKSVGPTLKLL